MQEGRRGDRREYMASWRAANRERLRLYKRAWNQAHPEKQKEYSRRHREALKAQRG